MRYYFVFYHGTITVPDERGAEFASVALALAEGGRIANELDQGASNAGSEIAVVNETGKELARYRVGTDYLN